METSVPSSVAPAASRRTSSVPAVGEGALLDLQQLFDRCLGNFPLIDRLICGFRQSLSGLLPQIVAAEQGGDLSTLERLAHRLKGEASNLGAVEISQSASRLEIAAGCNDFSTGDLVRQLEAAVERFQGSVFTFDSLPRPSSSVVDALARLRGTFRS